MKLIVISPEADDPREPAVLAALFAAGLTSYHLRKPAWSRDELAAFLREVPGAWRPRLVLHSHHELAGEFDIGGIHFKDTGMPLASPPASPALLRSRAVHDLTALIDSLDRYDRLLFSPVFPSISKPGYAPSAAFSRADLAAVLARPRRAEVIALGGIDRARLPACRDLGFDGVAVLGAVWQAADPVHAFCELQDALLAHAA
jgi:thiamine-phosphate pyrophosphorylase